MSGKRKALVICPGRGTYNKAELGYLARYHGGRAEMLRVFEAERERLGQESLASLDGAERFSVAHHTRGDNASLLIHACAYGDFLSIDWDRFDVVAVTGNSMGWYVALTCAGAVSMGDGGRIVNMMGTYMQEALIGGQMVYPLVGDDWREVPGRRDEIAGLMAEVNAEAGVEIHVSIELGGMLVLAGNDAGLKAMAGALPLIDRFPMMLANHAAFHTALQAPVSQRGLEIMGVDMFGQPDVPMIDGRGHIWQRGATDAGALHQYTFGAQVTEPYDFTRAVQVGVREFAPDCVIVLGPGTTLGGAAAQSLIGINWQGLGSKADFSARQDAAPYLLAMGREDQRALVT